MKKLISLLVALTLSVTCLAFTACGGKEKVMIYTSTEDYVITLLEEKLSEQFPDYEIKIEYKSTSEIAAKVLNEGESTDCDIIFAQEYAYLEQLAEADLLVDLSSTYDHSIFTEETLNTTAKNYLLPNLKVGGAVILNNKVITDNGLTKPTSYEDLLAEGYKGKISMPSPKSSSTGYMFYLSLVNAWGEDETLEYFDSFAENVLSFTSSGSGPVNALSQNEVAVGFGMISQAVEKISSGDTNLEIVYFEEGAPFNLYGNSIVKGKETDEQVMAVMDYLYEEFTALCNEKFYPETVLKDKTFEVEHYPANIKYADMSENTLATKEGLLAKWAH